MLLPDEVERVVRQEEVGIGAVEDDDVEIRVLLDQADELGQLARADPDRAARERGAPAGE